MKPVVRTPPRQSGNGYYFRRITHPQLTQLRARFYAGSRKIVPFDLLEEYLSPLAMAVWIMDDGSRDRRQLPLNTQSFTHEEVGRLAALVHANLAFN